MSMAACPHCGAQNPEGAAFCQECGKALPSATPSAPRVVSGEAMAGTAAGQTVQSDQLRKQAGAAATALFAVAILQALGGILFYYLLKENPQVSPEALQSLLIGNLVLAGIFAALGFWARVSPLPAAIVGLVLFVSVHLVSAIMDPATIVQGILVKVIVIVALIKAIQAGGKYRQLQVQMRASDSSSSQ